MTRTSTSSSSSSTPPNLSSGAQVLPSFAQTFSDLAGARNPPDSSQPTSHSHSHSHSHDHSRHSNTNVDPSATTERDRCRTEHRPRQSIHEKDTTLPPIFSHQGTNKKRTLDDMHRDDDRSRECEQDPGREWDDRGRDLEGHSSPQSSHIKREPSVSPPPEHFPQQQQQHYHQSHHSTHHPYSSSVSKKRRKSNYEYPLSPAHPSLSNERDNEPTYNDAYPRRGSVAGLAQSNPSSASSSASSSAHPHPHPQRPNPPMRRLSTMGNRTGSLSPQQPSNGIQPQNTTGSAENSSRSPNQTSLPPSLPTSKSPSQAHFNQSSSQQTQPQTSLPSSHFTISLPAPPVSFSTSRKRRLNAQSQGDISVPVPRPINTGSGGTATSMVVTAASGSGSGPGSTTTPVSASGPGSTSAPGMNAVNTDPGSSTSSHPRGPPRHLTIAPQSHTKRLEPLIHSAPVNGGFFHSARDMKANAVGGIAISGVGISSVRLRAGHPIVSGEFNPTSSSSPFVAGPKSLHNTLSSSGGTAHPPVTPMRIPELPPIPITPGGRKSTVHHSHSHSLSSHTPQNGHHNVLSQQQRQYVRTAPPHSAGLPLQSDKETTDRPFIVGDRLILDRERLEKDRERLLVDRDRSDRDRGANVPIAKNGGMRSGIVLGSVNVPRTPLFSSFVQQQPSGNTTGRPQQGRSVSASNPPPLSSSKYLQVPYTAGLVQSFGATPSKLPASSTVATGHLPLSHTTGSSSSSAPTISDTVSTSAPVGSTSQSKLPDSKTAFLTPFSDFYDSLADSKLLKSWLHEQLLKSNTLIEQLEKTVNGRVNNSGNTSVSVSVSDAVGSTSVTLTTAQLDDMIERRLGPVKNEMEGLRRRVGELEEMVYEARKSGWGRDAEVAKERKPREEMDASSVPSTGPLKSLRTSPPPPLLLTTGLSSGLETQESASFPIYDRNSAHGPRIAQDPKEVGNIDVEIQDVHRRGRKVGESLETTVRVRLRSRSRSPSRTRTRTRTELGEEFERRESSLTEHVSLTRRTSKSPLSTSAIPKIVENSTIRSDEAGRDEMSPNLRVNGSEDQKDISTTSSVSEHRISAVRFEG
ncbi:hypothetical protein Clacol_007422 [Clathrus columnatus]|uniref:Uncharacterized protein n=1 Tax=Clathrus columnatus TaxID=1419009 RepID=A0AAV5AEV1_9AGAM|nr:hypothetical protein Clacol_007422 [Clathrus columnatus]